MLCEKKYKRMHILELGDDLLTHVIRMLVQTLAFVSVSAINRAFRDYRNRLVPSLSAVDVRVLEDLTRPTHSLILRLNDASAHATVRFGDFRFVFDLSSKPTLTQTMLILVDNLWVDGELMPKKLSSDAVVSFMGKRYFDVSKMYSNGSSFLNFGGRPVLAGSAIRQILRLVDARTNVACFTSVDMQVNRQIPRLSVKDIFKWANYRRFSRPCLHLLMHNHGDEVTVAALAGDPVDAVFDF